MERLNQELQDRLQSHPRWSGQTELLRRETTAKGGIAAKHNQAGWNDSYLLKVLSN